MIPLVLLSIVSPFVVFLGCSFECYAIIARFQLSVCVCVLVVSATDTSGETIALIDSIRVLQKR